MTAEEKLVGDVRAYLASVGQIIEVKMFGGDSFLMNGNMVAAVSKRGLLLRVGKNRHRDALARAGARPMEMRGRDGGLCLCRPGDARRQCAQDLAR
jgi:TfoX/Sxy family transcriptional regulator of competence genes